MHHILFLLASSSPVVHIHMLKSLCLVQWCLARAVKQNHLGDFKEIHVRRHYSRPWERESLGLTLGYVHFESTQKNSYEYTHDLEREFLSANTSGQI